MGVFKINGTNILDIAEAMDDNTLKQRSAFFNSGKVSVTGLIEKVNGLYDRVTGAFYENTGSGAFNGDVLDYEVLRYIENSGTQFIDTGFVPNYTTGFRVEMRYSLEATGYRYCLLSNYAGTNAVSMEINPSNQSRLWLNDAAVDTAIGTNTTNINTTIYSYINGVWTLNCNGTQSTGSYAIPTSPTVSLYMFVDRALRYSTFNHKLKVYSCRIYSGDTLVRDFIPCKRKSDNVVGMLDRVNNVFYTNGGTGDFTYTSTNCDLLNYLESTGTQQINTGVKFNMTTDTCEVDFQSTVASQNGMIFANDSSPNHFWFYHYIAGNHIALYVTDANGSQILVGSRSIDTNRHTMRWTNKTFYIDNTVLGSDSRTLGTTPTNMYLFSWGNNYYYSGKIYSTRIYSGDTLVRDFIPCKGFTGTSKFLANAPSGYRWSHNIVGNKLKVNGVADTVSAKGWRPTLKTRGGDGSTGAATYTIALQADSSITGNGSIFFFASEAVKSFYLLVQAGGGSGASGGAGIGSFSGSGGGSGAGGIFYIETAYLPITLNMGASGPQMGGYQNGAAAGDCTFTYRGTTYTLGGGKGGIINGAGGAAGVLSPAFNASRMVLNVSTAATNYNGRAGGNPAVAGASKVVNCPADNEYPEAAAWGVKLSATYAGGATVGNGGGGGASMLAAGGAGGASWENGSSGGSGAGGGGAGGTDIFNNRQGGAGGGWEITFYY